MTILTDGATISPGMWQLFGLLYQAFKRELLDYYVEMCPVLWNFMSKGMAVPGTYPAEAPQMIFDMCKTVRSFLLFCTRISTSRHPATPPPPFFHALMQLRQCFPPRAAPHHHTGSGGALKCK